MSGFVSLVGAGPGDPDLLTLKAARRLAEADLVLYDALVSAETLALARRRAPLLRRQARGPPVDRAGGHPPADDPRGRGAASAWCASSAAIHSSWAAAARKRSPSREPAWRSRSIPGLTSAVRAPALSGIPVTHRGLASGFVVVSGHAETAYRPILESLAPNALTLVVLMGLASRRPLSRLLISRGWKAATPAALCLAAGTPEAYTWIGTLDALAAATVAPADAPGTIVIGDVRLGRRGTVHRCRSRVRTRWPSAKRDKENPHDDR